MTSCIRETKPSLLYIGINILKALWPWRALCTELSPCDFCCCQLSSSHYFIFWGCLAKSWGTAVPQHCVCAAKDSPTWSPPLQHHLWVSRQEALDSSNASNWDVGEKFSYLMVTKWPSRFSSWIFDTPTVACHKKPREEWCSREWEYFLPSKVASKTFYTISWRILKCFISGLTWLCGTGHPGKEKILPPQQLFRTSSGPPELDSEKTHQTDYLFDHEKHFHSPQKMYMYRYIFSYI